jgi:hypothetical protein
LFITGVNDTRNKLFSGVNDTGKKFIAGVVGLPMTISAAVADFGGRR